VRCATVADVESVESSQEAQIRGALERLEANSSDVVGVRNRAAPLLCQLGSLAVNVGGTPEEGRGLLEKYEGSRVLQVFLASSEACHVKLLRDPRKGPTPDGGPACNGPVSVVVHLAWLLGDHAAAGRVIELALDPVVVQRLPKARFWDAYFAAMRAVAHRAAIELPALKPRGLERYWLACMELAAALASGADPTLFIERSEAAFQKQNRDQRSTDWLSIDGDGRAPVKWSLRIASLQAATPTRAAA
jgi:hypothetical protein